MEKVNILIIDIQQFGVESTKQYNRNKEIDREQYFKLVKRIEELACDDLIHLKSLNIFCNIGIKILEKLEDL